MEGKLLNLATRFNKGAFKSSKECLSSLISLVYRPSGFAELLYPLYSEYKPIHCPPYTDEHSKQAAYEYILAQTTHPLLKIRLMSYNELAGALAYCDDAATRFALSCVLEERFSRNVLQDLVPQDLIVYKRDGNSRFDANYLSYSGDQAQKASNGTRANFLVAVTTYTTAPAASSGAEKKAASDYQRRNDAKILAALSADITAQMEQETQRTEAELLSQCSYLDCRIRSISTKVEGVALMGPLCASSASGKADGVGKDDGERSGEKYDGLLFETQDDAQTWPEPAASSADSCYHPECGDALQSQGLPTVDAGYSAAVGYLDSSAYYNRCYALENEFRDKWADAEARAAELAQQNTDLQASYSALRQKLKALTGKLEEMQDVYKTLKRENARTAAEKRDLELRLKKQTGMYNGIFAYIESAGKRYDELTQTRASRAGRY